MLLVFFFKQKTAYEMRISDWSSDVCSSDLSGPGPWRGPLRRLFRSAGPAFLRYDEHGHGASRRADRLWRGRRGRLSDRADAGEAGSHKAGVEPAKPLLYRSAEHTSELQSLMRISYAVFCLKKKKITS